MTDIREEIHNITEDLGHSLIPRYKVEDIERVAVIVRVTLKNGTTDEIYYPVVGHG